LTGTPSSTAGQLSFWAEGIHKDGYYQFSDLEMMSLLEDNNRKLFNVKRGKQVTHYFQEEIIRGESSDAE